MKEFTYLKDVKPQHVYRTKHGVYSDEIYTLDIEVTSLFKIGGKWQTFDKSISDYSEIEKGACPYIAMVGVNDKYYYTRDFMELDNFFRKISNPQITKTVWVFNLSYEFEFLLDIFAGSYTISDMIARKARKPISFKVNEMNIIFRCAYMLTNLSLARASEKYTTVEKKVGDLDYNVARSPITPLTSKELDYCEYDLITLYEIIKYFRNEYKHIKTIPLTQTGELRYDYRRYVPKYHFENMRKLVPDVDTFIMLMASFAGGLTHSNIIHTNEVIKDNIGSFDISSSYPAVMVSKKYPVGKWREITTDILELYPLSDYCRISIITYENIESNFYNHYIALSKCSEVNKPTVDNGRIVKADKLTTCITEIDEEIIDRTYHYVSKTYDKIIVCKKGYLPKTMISYVLDLYEDKTTLKNVAGQEDYYMKKKQILNSMFGACCQNVLKSACEWDDLKGWVTPTLDRQYMSKVLDDERKKKTLLFAYQFGVYVTAHARASLFNIITANDNIDSDVVYYDTDSIKLLNVREHLTLFKEYNKRIDDEMRAVCDFYELDIKKTNPLDIKGKSHPLGHYENEGDENYIAYSEFVTLGAKRYAYRSVFDNELHITVSGVGKNGVIALKNDISNFNRKLIFDYDTSFKNTVHYLDDMSTITFDDCNGVPFTSTQKHGVAIYPTTYSMSINPAYEILINQYFELTKNMLVD